MKYYELRFFEPKLKIYTIYEFCISLKILLALVHIVARNYCIIQFDTLILLHLPLIL